ncbi:Hypothetical predicted protein [Mytilus galloprovincialis]|uniref:Uncharacterized protein n=1 Tax=Mytilus galloprovincialis TaxID=29158 RepID=A0A8B6HD62_MYTGA|nr:Hypothetical predicted protein [Mytilus galloprovincialis]
MYCDLSICASGEKLNILFKIAHEIALDRIAVGAPYRKKFSIHVVSSVNGEKELTETNGEKQTTETTEDGNNLLPSPELPPPMVVTSVAEFKRDMGLYPLPRPYIDLQKARSKL